MSSTIKRWNIPKQRDCCGGADYAYVLDRYDYQKFQIDKTISKEPFKATYENAMATMLLYLVTKNHSFSDGKKRIAAFLFLWFMERNGILYNAGGSKRIGNNTLVSLTLMITQNRTEKMETMVKMAVNLINKNN